MGTEYYEDEEIVSEYLLFHYGEDGEFLLNGIGPTEAFHFPQRSAALCSDLRDLSRGRALDLGCAVGGATLELSKYFDEVIGIDYSHALIDAAKRLLEEKELPIRKRMEGEFYAETTIAVPPETRPERVTFQQGDAMALPEDLGSFDFILAANLIDRLPDPAQCLKALKQRINPGGRLLITSPYTWLEAFTPKSNWLGGFATENGVRIRSVDTISDLLAPEFDLEERTDLPFLIREHERKNQYTIAEATMWRKTT